MEGNYISGEFISKRKDGAIHYMTVQYLKDSSGNIKTNGSFKTGDKITITGSDGSKTYTALIYGDVNGDGKIILAISAICLIFFIANLKEIAATGCLISLAIVGYDVYNLYNIITTNEYGSLASIGMGPILIGIGAIIAIYGCVDCKKNSSIPIADNNQNIKFCPNCGTLININHEFCSKCGTKQG